MSIKGASRVADGVMSDAVELAQLVRSLDEPLPPLLAVTTVSVLMLEQGEKPART